MPTLRGTRVELRPVERDDADALRRIHVTPEVAAWWGRPDETFPFDDDPRTTSFSIFCDGAVVGLIQLSEELDPDYRYAWIDLYVDPAHHRRGIGIDAVRTAIQHLTEDRGHHRVTIDPASDNLPAIRCYEEAGFRPVGITRSSWRDTATGQWRDSLLMELVVAPPGAAASA